MLELKNITKNYQAGAQVVPALKGISISFRQSEFVAILGPSGCGKTTLLNIVGGLDRYTKGDLLINGISTKKYKDKDWDTYRNHEIGFVFQSYNLIPHLTVLENVELSLTISGIKKEERKRRAIEALKRVGLEDQLRKLPNQLSGGQMQRVAIARAIVNEPHIILADEPTGALDSETSVQVMEILKEISKECLVIMVTHNPDLAYQYATRIVRLLDGELKDDSNPYQIEEIKEETRKVKDAKMSFLTALSLSFKNLLTKKGRTFMISFAGSIGIIGIALVLSVSNGFTNYVNKMQNDMLSGYPVTISRFAADYSAMENMVPSTNQNQDKFPDDDQLHIYDPTETAAQAIHMNLIDKEYVDYVKDFYEKDLAKSDDNRLTNSIQFSYAGGMNVISKHNDKYTFVDFSTSSSSSPSMMEMFMGTSSTVFQEAMDNTNFIQNTYDVIYGNYPKNQNEVALIVDQKNRINVNTLKALGLNYLDEEGKNLSTISFADLIYQDETKPGVEFKVIPNDQYYEPQDISSSGEASYYLPAKYNENVTNDLANYYQSIHYETDEDMTLKIVGVLRLNEESPLDLFNTGILYLPSLTQTFINNAKASQIANKQNNNRMYLFGDYKDIYESNTQFKEIIEKNGGNAYKIPTLVMTSLYSAYITGDQPSASFLTDYVLESAKQQIGASDVPSSIIIYPKSFPAKRQVNQYLDAWNEGDTHKGQKIVYTDAAGVFSSTIGQLIDIISYVLIAFTAISLVVSSIMIGIITYVSVIERTKEIGVLRSLGARKQDVSSVFNAETLLIGFVAGLLGVFVAFTLCFPINLIIRNLAGPSLTMNLAILNPLHALILLLISMVLTFISGLIPASMAAKKDPVIALRTE